MTLHGSVTTTSTRDVHGRETSRTLPSLSVVTSSTTRGWLTSQTLPGATLTYSCDAWGGLSEVAGVRTRQLGGLAHPGTPSNVALPVELELPVAETQV